MLEVAFRLDEHNECIADPILLTADVLATDDSRVAGAFTTGQEVALRLIAVRGLDRWLQAPVSQVLLDVDLAVAYSHAGLAEHGAPLAQSGVDALRSQANEWLGLTQLPAALISESVSVLREIEQLLRLDDPQREVILRQASALEAMPATPGRTRWPQSHFAQPSPPRVRILAGIDRLQVPSRVLDLAQGYDLTVLQDGHEVEVSVPAFAPAPAQADLCVRLVDRRTDEVMAVAPLTLKPERGRYTATLSTLADPAMFAVDVYASGTGYEPRIAEDDRPARAALADVQDAWTDYRRAIALHALGMAHEQALEDARGILATTPGEAPEGLLAQREDLLRRLAGPLPTSGPQRTTLAELASAFSGNMG